MSLEFVMYLISPYIQSVLNEFPTLDSGRGLETMYVVFSVCGVGGIGMALYLCLLSVQDHLLRNAEAFTWCSKQKSNSMLCCYSSRQLASNISIIDHNMIHYVMVGVSRNLIRIPSPSCIQQYNTSSNIGMDDDKKSSSTIFLLSLRYFP